MFLKQIFLGIVGMSFGLLAAGGVFTVLIAVGLIPRFAGKMHVSKKVVLFEEAVIFGTVGGSFISIFDRYSQVGDWVIKNHIFGNHITQMLWYGAANGALIAFGTFAGIFVGCLALAIAEMLDSIPIFARRIQFRHGLGIAVLAMAFGKAAGSLIYFFYGMYLYGGI